MINRSMVFIGIILVFILLLSWGAPVFAAAEVNPNNSAGDIQRLKQIIAELQNKIIELTQDLKTANTKLEDVQQDLENYKAELAKLAEQLKESSASVDSYKNQLEEAQRLLGEANQKLEEHEKKMEQEIKNIKLQRNIAIAVAILALIF
ncbi:MAG TPA: hypothetical protein VHY08_10280 [Bacillota bacterium]|nr:hypothetical protein [Bacillota bacterium]